MAASLDPLLALSLSLPPQPHLVHAPDPGGQPQLFVATAEVGRAKREGGGEGGERVKCEHTQLSQQPSPTRLSQQPSHTVSTHPNMPAASAASSIRDTGCGVVAVRSRPPLCWRTSDTRRLVPPTDSPTSPASGSGASWEGVTVVMAGLGRLASKWVVLGRGGEGRDEAQEGREPSSRRT